MKNISRFIFFKLMGWRIVYDQPFNLKKYIIIGAPHTSNLDFILGALMKFSTGLPVNFIAKKSLFKWPYGIIFKSLGGTPVDRSKNNNLVDSIIQLFNDKDTFILALSPEGTRKRVSKWKTGFYYIAKGANIPVVMHAFDFGNKIYRISAPYYLTGDIKKDFEHFHHFYKDIKAKNPDQFDPDFHKNIV